MCMLLIAIVRFANRRSKGADDVLDALTILVGLCVEVTEQQNNVVSQCGVDLFLQLIIGSVIHRIRSIVDGFCRSFL